MNVVPTSTYRVQITSDFDLHAATSIVDYLRALGTGWIYLSPLLTAESGSPHGYDVVDHAGVDPARGGSAGLQALADAAHAAGLGVLVDIVPNHMGVATPRANRWWWDVLTNGREARYADAFDIDWEFGGGKIRVPVLGDETDPVFEVVDGELDYAGGRYPLRPGTALDRPPAEVHAAQHYELINWRRADQELNYRRFFAVNTLAGIRVELAWVFDESHREIVRWVDDGLVDGLRVDHPDGLADPGRYLDALRDSTGGTYVVVEKILEGDEQLPPSWSTAGTTGYDALADIDRVLIDPDGRAVLNAVDALELGEGPAPSWESVIHDTKRHVADGILRSEVLRLERDILLSDEAADLGLVAGDPATADAIAELLACFPVYRTYLPFGDAYLDAAVVNATTRRPDLAETLASLKAVLADPGHRAAVRFQQTTGMVMAKGVEDRAFYRYNRLVSLTEVGGDPSEFSLDVAEFHGRQQRRQAGLPGSMTALTTHDTKLGEDVRARLNVLSEIPDEWRTTLGSLRDLAPLPDGSLEERLWQAVIGAWPASRERIHTYAEKAAREAGASTSWDEPDDPFERRLRRVVDSIFDRPEVGAVLQRFVARVEQPGWSNSLAAKLVQLTAPGVPDVYQGSELWDTSFVDPDNRRTVDFDSRRRILRALQAGAVPQIDSSGAAKLLVTSRALQLRRAHPELFTRYLPVGAHGPAAEHAVAFDRGGAITVATRLPIGLQRGGGWGETGIVVADRPHQEMITGRTFDGGVIDLADLLRPYPVALLAPAEVAS